MGLRGALLLLLLQLHIIYLTFVRLEVYEDDSEKNLKTSFKLSPHYVVSENMVDPKLNGASQYGINIGPIKNSRGLKLSFFCGNVFMHRHFLAHFF